MERLPYALDHRIHLLFDFCFEEQVAAVTHSLLHLPVAHVAKSEDSNLKLVDRSRVAQSNGHNVAHKTLWELKDWPVSKDLHEFVRDLLDSSTKRHDNATPRGPKPPPRCIRLSQNGRNVVTGRYRHPIGEYAAAESARNGLLLRLPKSAQSAAVGTQTATLVAISDIALHLFATGVGIAVVTIRLGDGHGSTLSAESLIEILPYLADARRRPMMHWHEMRGESDEQRFSIEQMLKALLPEQCTLADRQRIYSYCALVFEEALPLSRRRDLAFRLSRHYTTRYSTREECEGTYFVEPFENVIHAASHEGACTIVDGTHSSDDEPIPFTTAWLDNVHEVVYLPLQVAAMHEYVKLLKLAQGAGGHIDPAAAESGEMKALQDLSNEILFFRLRYRLAEVSRITMHNLTYAATAQALRVDVLSEKIARDLVAVERRLGELSASRAARTQLIFERWFTPVAAISSGGITYLTVSAILERVNLGPGWKLGVAAFLALLVALYACARQFRGSSQYEEVGDHEARHAAIEASTRGRG